MTPLHQDGALLVKVLKVIVISLEALKKVALSLTISRVCPKTVASKWASALKPIK